MARRLWLTGVLGLAIVLLRRLRPRRGRYVASVESPHDSRAEELRRKLDESREAPPERAEPAPAEAGPERPEQGGGLEERRRQIHERGKAAIDEMRPGRD